MRRNIRLNVPLHVTMTRASRQSCYVLLRTLLPYELVERILSETVEMDVCATCMRVHTQEYPRWFEKFCSLECYEFF